MAKYFNRVKFLTTAFAPSSVMLTDGHMGDGKTFTSVSLIQEFMESYIGEPVFFATNFVFKYRTPQGLVRKDPPNVYHIETLEALLRLAGDLMSKYGFGNFRLIWALDEAQNFIPAEEHLSPTSKAIYKMFSNIRKFGICVWLLTTQADHLGPRMRSGPVTGDRGGFIQIMWKKDMTVIKNYLAAHGIDRSEAKRFITVRWKPDMAPMVMYIPSPSWTTPLDDLPIGGYAYDTSAISTFSIGSSNFSLTRFLEIVAAADDIPTAMQQYFASIDSKVTKNDNGDVVELDPWEERILLADRCRQLGIKWKEIAYITNTKDSTLRGHYNSYFLANPSRKLSATSKKSSSKSDGLARVESKEERVLTKGKADEDPSSLILPSPGCTKRGEERDCQ